MENFLKNNPDILLGIIYITDHLKFIFALLFVFNYLYTIAKLLEQLWETEKKSFPFFFMWFAKLYFYIFVVPYLISYFENNKWGEQDLKK